MARQRITIDETVRDRLGNPFSVRVTPGASREALTVEDHEGQLRLKVAVTAIAEPGKANAAVIKLVAKAHGVAKTRLSVVRGETSRDKQLQID